MYNNFNIYVLYDSFALSIANRSDELFLDYNLVWFLDVNYHDKYQNH